MAFKFPFTNYHELNLTWVLEQLKKLFEESNENVETIENYENRLSAVETELPVVEATADQAATVANAAATLAQTAKTTADTANENALTASAQAGLARQEAATAEAEAQAATQAAQQAQATAQDFDGRITQAEADASEALQEAQSFENRVNAAINTANNAANTATIAQGIAVNANQNVATALDTAQAAEDTAEAADAKADTNADNIGDLSELTTTAKTDLVSAINEAAASGGAVDSVNGKTGNVVLNAGDIEIIPGLVYSNGTTGKAVNTLAASVAPVESSGTASRSYAVGELLIYNYQLYRVVSQIVVGGTLTPGTNIMETTVKTEIANNSGGGTGLLTPEQVATLKTYVNNTSYTYGNKTISIENGVIKISGGAMSNRRGFWIGKYIMFAAGTMEGAIPPLDILQPIGLLSGLNCLNQYNDVVIPYTDGGVLVICYYIVNGDTVTFASRNLFANAAINGYRSFNITIPVNATHFCFRHYFGSSSDSGETDIYIKFSYYPTT